MAAPSQSPVTFSYAQAAKGRTPTSSSSHPPSSKVTSGTASPANGTFSELGPTSNWADDVEATVKDKMMPPPPQPPQPQPQQQLSQKPLELQIKAEPLKGLAVERTKSESKPQHTFSGISSPDLAASSTTTATDDSVSGQNGTSSDSTWETKSQTSEPAWIADRKERQSNDGPAKADGKESIDSSSASPLPPKPAAMQEALPPAVNPWAKRAEDAKAKSVLAAQQSVAAPKPVTNVAAASESKDALPLKPEPRKKIDSVAVPSTTPLSGIDNKKPAVFQGPRASEPRVNAKHSPRLPGDSSVAGSDNTVGSGKFVQRETKAALRALPQPPPPPPTTDETSWPTPDTVQERERKEAPLEKDGGDDENDAEASQGSKASKRTWKVLPVTPTIVWETPEMNRSRAPGGDKGPRPGNASRARGGFRGGSNGPRGGDRVNNSRAAADLDNAARAHQALAGREPMPPPASKAARTTNGDQLREVATPASTKAAASAPLSTDPASIAGAATAPPASAPNTEPSTNASNAAGVTLANGQSATKAPSPIPRSSSLSANIKDGADSTRVVREMHPIRNTTSENRRESRSFEPLGNKDWNSSAPRGGKRSGRGRGGSREFSNGHQPTSPFHGYPDFASAAGASPYGMPPSPSAFSNARSNHQYGHQQQSRGGWSRSGQRAQSIPLENMYGPRFSPFNQMSPVPNFVPNEYGQFGYPMSPVPYSPAMDQQYLMDLVGSQLEYYFSLDNLIKDLFLRKNMDSQGFVFFDVITNFNRIKQLTTDKDLIRSVCLRSESIEIRVGDDNRERLRRREGWQQFLLPMEQRELSAQNDGPAQLQLPEQPLLWQGNAMPFRAQGSGALPRRSYDSSIAGVNGMPPHFGSMPPPPPLVEAPYGDGTDAEEMRGRPTKSPMRDLSASTQHAPVAVGKDDEPDVFPDEHMNVLTVVVKTNHHRLPHHHHHHHLTSRTFSNGSIDPRTAFAADGDKTADEAARPAVNGEASTNGDEAGRRSLSRIASPSQGRSPDKDAGGPEISLFWVKDKDMPSDSLPSGAVLEPYMQLRFKALDQRSQAATGTCPYDLDVLYQFWSHFLIRNFNNKMYGEFKFFALDDAKQRRSTTGMHNLMQFYAKALASSMLIRDSIVKDYIELVKNEPPGLEGQPFKQLRSAWRNGALNLKNRKKLTEIADEGLRARLES